MFEEWGLLGNTLIFLASLVALSKASSWTITSSIKVADITGLGKTAVGFILLAFATSLAELFVSAFAALTQAVGLAVGNVLGSNIVNICLILGICFLMTAFMSLRKVKHLLSMAREEVRGLHFGLFVASVVPLLLLYVGYASRFIGMILLAIFVFYMHRLSKAKRSVDDVPQIKGGEKLRKCVCLTLIGAAGVIISSYFIVESASNIAIALGVPSVIIGATIVAFGTSLPELATSVESVRRGHMDLALGNIVGSCFVNITCILGVTLAVTALEVDMAIFSDLIVFSLLTNLFLWYFLLGERVSWREGAILLFMYFVFLVVSFGGR